MMIPTEGTRSYPAHKVMTKALRKWSDNPSVITLITNMLQVSDLKFSSCYAMITDAVKEGFLEYTDKQNTYVRLVKVLPTEPGWYVKGEYRPFTR